MCVDVTANQWSKKRGSTEAALLGNGRPNWGNVGGKKKREENKIRKEGKKKEKEGTGLIDNI